MSHENPPENDENKVEKTPSNEGEAKELDFEVVSGETETEKADKAEHLKKTREGLAKAPPIIDGCVEVKGSSNSKKEKVSTWGIINKKREKSWLIGRIGLTSLFTFGLKGAKWLWDELWSSLGSGGGGEKSHGGGHGGGGHH